MRQTSEAFARAMLENEEIGNSQSFTETMAKFEQNMTEKIEKMQTDLLGKIAEQQSNVSRETFDVHEVTEDNEVENELTEDNESEE